LSVIVDARNGHGGHVAKKCEPLCEKCRDGLGCVVTNLFICKFCKAAEGTLPQHCPGEPISYDDQQLIYTNTLDFHLGVWINRSPDHWEIIDDFYNDMVPKAIKRLNDARR
jgi:hypothetical protein